ncbi:sulfate adenylyltransferase subunit CysN [Vibrio metschnikovii]|uniref:sulfate adenylyltransferase subunit CysN n=1 Tax=Vibrio metschnikovii TaxID=28172 RepID=UPI0029703FBB|nr:sulfate adenylyltransferase subunit CysN [Vibrio metschnikovii]EKO3659837.1 sulfate adenylyltransferase subunit CysN [Vibrio metschnikovii]
MSHSSALIANDIEAYLQVHENKDLLRFLTCGSVDDGKSTLIGRLLFDSQLIYDDQLSAIVKDSQKFNTTDQSFDLALLVDGLQSEREQGITIDVAYRYFSTEKRKFIIADTPGHEQYTRNMATGASNCDLAIVMVDAREGIKTQTRRHSYLCSLLGIKQIIVAVNKMDLVDYRQDIYQAIKTDYRQMASSFAFDKIRFVPISALRGDNVVSASEKMDWYPGAPLMKLLETVDIKAQQANAPMRFPVQYVNRPNHDFRGFCGTLASGQIELGDTIRALPSGQQATVTRIYTYDGDLTTAQAGQAITLLVDKEIDISRGDMLVSAQDTPSVSKKLTAQLVWMDQQPLALNKEYLFKFATKVTAGQFSHIDYKTDVNTLNHYAQDSQNLALNEIAHVAVDLTETLVIDNYHQLPKTGAFIVIDRLSNLTVGAGMVDSERHDSQEKLTARQYSATDKALNEFIRTHYPEWGCKAI